MTQPVDPGAIATSSRALAPDVARGGMLLLIALANVHLWSFGHPTGIRGYPELLDSADTAVTVVQLLLVDGRAYPLFGFLFGYGIVQLASRRSTVGMPVGAVTRLVRRRGAWMVLIGFLHGLLLWAGDIVGAYGVLAVLMAGLLVAGSGRALLVTAGIGLFCSALLYAAASMPVPGESTAMLPSMETSNYAISLLLRAIEWSAIGLVAATFSVFGAVALGAWAARRRILDEPERHRPLLQRMAVGGLGAAVLLGLPLALMTVAGSAEPALGLVLAAGATHAIGGYLGGFGYAALFGLIAIRLAHRTPGAFTSALRSCGQRSLSCYLAQSVVFALLLPAWSLGLGDGAHLWQTALVGIGAWAVILVVAHLTARAGLRGPAEVVLRRLTYGKPKRDVAAT
ncbi:DUF418 domain-containing protein [Actinomycetes bacterium KLBMP 9759]